MITGRGVAVYRERARCSRWAGAVIREASARPHVRAPLFSPADPGILVVGEAFYGGGWLRRDWCQPSSLTLALPLLLVTGLRTPGRLYFSPGPCSATLGYLVARRRSGASKPDEPRPASNPWMWVVRLAFLSVIVLVAVEMVSAYAAEPHGWWDAFSIWNLRARFLASGGPGWSGAFSETQRRIFSRRQSSW